MKILFLDIDGVLNSVDWNIKNSKNFLKPFRSGFDRELEMIDPTALSLLSKFLRENEDVKVVISSTWRILHSLWEIERFFFTKTGFFPTNRVIGVTPVINQAGSVRGDEVDKWIAENVESLDGLTYACLDDSSDFHPYQNLVRTDCEHGLLDEHIDQLRKIFNGE